MCDTSNRIVFMNVKCACRSSRSIGNDHYPSNDLSIMVLKKIHEEKKNKIDIYRLIVMQGTHS
jgi:hypothetical protein